MVQKETVPATRTARAGGAAAGAAKSATPSGKSLRRTSNKRAASGLIPGKDDGLANGVATEQLKQRKKPRLQHQREQRKLTRIQVKQQQEHYEQEKVQESGQQEQGQPLHPQQLAKRQHRQGHPHKRQELLMDECEEQHLATEDEVPAEREAFPLTEITTEPPASTLPDSACEGAQELDRAAAIDAAAAADPYLLEDADYLRRETRWLNRQRVLLLGSRGISARSRHLIEDFKKLLPHHKSEASAKS